MPNPMNVCMLAYAHYHNDARIKAYVRTLEAEGHSVDVIALREHGASPREQRSQGTTFRILEKYQGASTLLYVWSYLHFFLRAAWLLSLRSLGRRYHVVHVHNMPNLLVFAALVPRLLGARLKLDVHDLMPVNYLAKFGGAENAWPLRLLRLEQRVSAFFVEDVFCADHNQRDYLARECRIPPQKITVLMNLPNVQMFQPVQRSRKDDGIFRIVYHGTIAHRLGTDLMLRAMALVASRVRAQLYIYGAGDYLDEARALAAELGLEQVVHFSGSFFPVEQIPQIVSDMDLGLIGNRRNLACDRYMLPVKLLEYVYLGIPVVAPRLEVIARYFSDDMLAFYEPENVEQMAARIIALSQDAAERTRLSRAAAVFYQQHSIEAQAQTYLGLIAQSGDRLQPVPVVQ